MINGERIQELREANKYSREKLGELAGIGTTQIYRYEKGDSDASGETVARLAKVFGVTADYLLGLSDNPLGYDQKLTAKEISIINAIRNDKIKDAMRVILEMETV